MQQQAQAEVGAEVLKHFPDGADVVVIEISETYPTSLYMYYSQYADGTTESMPMDMDFDDEVFSRLREAMYQEGLGTWFSAVLRIDRSGAVDGQFDYDSEPEWDAPVDPIAYVTDQERYPRDVENQPDWLKAKLAEGLARREGRRQ
ncbi:hypothetical protein [Gordonia araii]|uniref:hypothetical protein n=1 Tax=Gordonia araii TaxID=263909 RepID=UPI001FE1C4D9|nr:hypothetical protein [Gordonia araii]